MDTFRKQLSYYGRLLFRFIAREKALTFFLWVAIAIVFIRVYYSETPEYFSYGSEIGDFLYDISIGYMISWFFFFLVDFVKRQKDSKNLELFLAKKSFDIIHDGYEQLAIIYPKKEVQGKIRSIQQKELEDKFNQIPLNDSKYFVAKEKVNVVGNILGDMRYWADHSMEIIKSIQSFSAHWDSEYNKMIFEISESDYFSKLKDQTYSSIDVLQYEDVSDLINPMISYLNRIIALENYCKLNIEEYRIKYSAQLGWEFFTDIQYIQ